MSNTNPTSDAVDWRAEARGLGYMIRQIAQRYRQAKNDLGGDSELLASSILQSDAYVDGPLREMLGEQTATVSCDRCGGHGHIHPHNRLEASRWTEGIGLRSRGGREKRKALLTRECPKCGGSGTMSAAVSEEAT